MFGGGFTFFRRGEVAKYTSTLAFASYKKEVFEKVDIIMKSWYAQKIMKCITE